MFGGDFVNGTCSPGPEEIPNIPPKKGRGTASLDLPRIASRIITFGCKYASAPRAAPEVHRLKAAAAAVRSSPEWLQHR